MESKGNNPSNTHLQPQNSTTSTQSSNTNPLFVFPPEIISEILSRLPVKSLSRFRCVSKEWCSFISSSQFVKLHLKVSSSSKDYVHHKILCNFTGPQSFTLKQWSLQSVMSDPVTESVELDYPTKSPDTSPWIVGSCNGLVCIEIDWDLFIWNPSTGKFKKLPNSYMFESRFDYTSHTYGFGHDMMNDDYKVVWMFCSRSENENNKVMVYSLRNDFWKSIEGLKGELLIENARKYVNGKIHWTVYGKLDSIWEIVSLDLTTEVHEKVEQPNYGEVREIRNLTLEVVSGYLSVLCQYERAHTDLWVMREYGVNESWTKMVTIPPLDKIVTIPPLDDPWNKRFCLPICISKNGEVVLVLNEDIVVYDPKNRTLRYPEITNFRGFYDAKIYVESLVSPVADSESRREQQQ